MSYVLVLLFLCVSSAVSAQTAYYVDPDYTGGTRDGQASTPWQSMADTVTNTPWTVVNTALASDDVTLYFSARNAGSDTAQLGHQITMNRTDTSTHRLTLDGCTKYNTNDSTPSWADYPGACDRLTSKHSLSNDGGNGWALGWGGNPPIVAMDYVTLRGFIATGSSARFRLEGGGSHFIVEYNYIHDVSGGGPGIQFNAGAYAYANGPTPTNPSQPCVLRVTHLSDDVIFRYNKVDNTADENLYFGGAGEDGTGQGFDCQGHTNIQFIGNILSNPGAFGVGEGDCFDFKNGNTNVTYRGNIVGPCSRNGIPPQGASISHRPQNMVIEQNLIHDTNTSGGTGAITLVVTWTTVPDTVRIRNNVIYNGSIHVIDGNSNTNGDGAKYDIYIDNNTVDNGFIASKYVTNGSIRNNIALLSTDVISYAQVTGFTETNNAVYTTGPGGSGDIALSSGQVTALFVNRGGRDYRLAGTGSAAYNTGTDLSGSFTTDYVGVVRPQGGAWDIGAYEFTGTIAPANVRLLAR